MADRYRMSDDEWDDKVRARNERWKQSWAATGDMLSDMPPWIAERYGLKPRGASAALGGATGDVRWVGGIDFGFRNPFAAVWGFVDADNVLWLTGEHGQRQRPLSHHMQKLPRHVTWYADPAGAGEIAELSQSGFIVRSTPSSSWGEGWGEGRSPGQTSPLPHRRGDLPPAACLLPPAPGS